MFIWVNIIYPLEHAIAVYWPIHSALLRAQTTQQQKSRLHFVAEISSAVLSVSLCATCLNSVHHSVMFYIFKKNPCSTFSNLFPSQLTDWIQRGEFYWEYFLLLWGDAQTVSTTEFITAYGQPMSCHVNNVKIAIFVAIHCDWQISVISHRPTQNPPSPL